MSTPVASALAGLKAHQVGLKDASILDMMESDDGRFGRFSIQLGDLLFDYSRHRINATTQELLVSLARAAKLEERRAALFGGERVNITENRPALHMALRADPAKAFMLEGQDIMSGIVSERERVEAFAEDIRAGRITGATGLGFTDIVNIGIGGSDLGPAMVVKALHPFVASHIHAHFVSNVDGADIADTLRGLDPGRTLFIVSSKTFTTQETMTNAASARAFIAKALGEAAVPSHFAAVSTRPDKAAQFGIPPERVFSFSDWVGGRYSVWSSIGLAVTIAVGASNFRKFLEGARAVDQHFCSAPLERNIPVMMALLGVWYRNVWDYGAHAVIPYDQRLARFPAYLQQLDMESNGKSVTLEGGPVPTQTGPVIWGGPGTNGQHAFFQLLHQGTSIVPVDFLVAAQPIEADQHHHDLLFANCLAQGEAFMRGRSRGEVEALLRTQGLGEQEIASLAPHKVFAGNRPSSTFLYRALTPETLGALIALYEHKVFVQSVIWNINPFDQWGVELGKELASRLVPIVSDAGQSLQHLDASTAGLVAARRSLQAGSGS